MISSKIDNETPTNQWLQYSAALTGNIYFIVSLVTHQRQCLQRVMLLIAKLVMYTTEMQKISFHMHTINKYYSSQLN